MCNAYNVTTNAEAIVALLKGLNAVRQRKSNQDWLPGVFPNYRAPVVRLVDDELQLDDALWGMPTPPQFLVTKTGRPMSYDKGVTNIRNVTSPHWRRWLGVEHRCLVPFTRFSEPDATHQNHWFDFIDGRELAFMAGICAPLTRQIRAKDIEPTTDLFYGFLTTEANAVVRPIHAKAMPVILTEPEEWRTWLEADWSVARELQRPLDDGLLFATAHVSVTDQSDDLAAGKL